MRLLFVADGRSPTACSWVKYWLDVGYETHLISTYSSEPIPGLSSYHTLPVALARIAGPASGKQEAGAGRRIVRRLRAWLRPVRYLLGPINLSSYQQEFLALVAEIQPDLVHALRIPFEGMLASVTPADTPLIVSTWGNDLTLHARGSFMMRSLTRRTLRRCDGLITDTKRDLSLANKWGYDQNKPTLTIPGSGGIKLEEIEAIKGIEALPEELPEGPIVVNPRGQRPGSLRQDNFFRSIPLVLKTFPQVIFVCPSLKGEADAERWMTALGIEDNVKLWPRLERDKIISLYKRSLLFVSPSIHDGTPNSMLEAMACGCFPVVGDIESMREWVISGDNGFLVDASSPHSLADGIIAALENPALVSRARMKNARIIAERAAYQHCMAMSEAFYRKILNEQHP
jgi:hypothetical protein